MGWMVKASATFQWDGKNVGIVIPLEVVKEALLKKYPSFVEWPGEFVDGDQGPSFWVEGSQSPKSAIVRPTGMQTFANHATKGFYSWAELLGIDFVKQYQAEALGIAVREIYGDGRNYYRKNPAGVWLPNDKSGIVLHLRVDRGVSPKPDKLGISDLDRCLMYVDNHQRVAGAGPFVMRKPGLVTIDGRPYLNTLENRCMKPSEEPGVFGPDGNFVWLSQWLSTFLNPHHPQFQFFVSWIHLFYKSVLYSLPNKGHTLVIAGGVGVGKSFFFNRILGAMVGGCVDASDFLAGNENFNSAMFASPLLISDDSTSSTSRAAHRLFSEIVKKFTANQKFLYKEKFVKELSVEWFGRIVIGCNADEESVRKVPDLDISILDKLIILLAASVPGIKFPPREELEKILEKELPYFCRWVLDWQIPDECKGASRFGMKHYCEPSLFETAQKSSNTAAFMEILEDFLHEHFGVHAKTAKEWTGTAFQLHKAILSDTSTEHAMRAFSVDAIGRHLSMLKAKGHNIEVIDEKGCARRWRLFPDSLKNQNTKEQ
jgi:hypothetical protein